MLSALHGQWAGAIMEHQLRHAGEGAAVLTQHELVLSDPSKLQMQEALAAPGDRGQRGHPALQTRPHSPTLKPPPHGPQEPDAGIP